MRAFFVFGVLLVCFVCMGLLFWHQEIKYALPTPVPVNYVSITPSERIVFPSVFNITTTQSTYFHFFNPDCPCSRFNLKHFKSLTNQFQSSLKIYAVIPAYADFDRAKKVIDDERIVLLQDTKDELAKACGVYSTPQAVVIDSTRQLFYRGNYNRSRYCTLKESNYAEIDLTALVKGETAPHFDAFATQSYGCELPTDQDINF